MAEGHACMLPMPDAGDFLNALEDVYRIRRKPPSMILISFPHNPTTVCVDLDFFKEIVRLARHHGTMVVHDFAYADLGFDGYKPPSILQVEGAKDVAVEIFSHVEKLQHGGMACRLLPRQSEDDRARSRASRAIWITASSSPSRSPRSSPCASAKRIRRRSAPMYQKRRDVLVEGLERAGWPVEKPRGSMFLWAPIPEPFHANGLARIFASC